jgi:tetratricopeptide (TPR) repeat protein
MSVLSVFRGGFTRRAAQAVTGATLRELKGLVDKSLVAHTAMGRYEIHELLRQYAGERLEAHPYSAHAARDRHSAYYAGFLGRWQRELKSARQQTALAEIEADAENTRAAWDWAVERGQVESLDQGMEGLCLFYERTARFERGDKACRGAAERLAEIGASAGGPAVARAQARALTWRAVFHDYLSRYESARGSLRASLSLLDDAALADVDVRQERAFVLRQEGNVASRLGELERARGQFEGSLALYRELEDRWGTAMTLVALGWTAWGLGAYAEMEAWTREALVLRRALGDQRGVADSLYSLSFALLGQGQYEEAGRLAREAIAIGRETGDRIYLAWGLMAHGDVLSALGKYPEALAAFEESVAISDELETPAWKAVAIMLLGHAQTNLGHYRDARVALQSSLRMARERGYSLAIRRSLLFLGCVALAEGAYAEARRWLQELFTVAQASSGLLRQTVEAEIGLYLGLAEWGQGNLGPARDQFSTGLKIMVELWPQGYWWEDAWVAAIALLLADEGDAYAERAVELYALACRNPGFANSRMWQDIVGKHITAVAETLPPEVVAAAQERGRARDMDATIQELLEELGG